MFSSESTCNPYKTPHFLARGTKTSFSHKTHTHTRTHQLEQLEQKITVLRSRDIDSNGVPIDTAPIYDIEGSNGKNNNRSGLENGLDMKMSKLFMYEEPESLVRYRSSCLRSEVRSFLYATWHSVVLKTNEI